MNEKFTNSPQPDDESISRKLNRVAEQTQANGQFAAELEEKLRMAHQPETGWFSQVSPTLGWVALMVVLVLVLSWSIKALIPSPQPSGNPTPHGFVCPVTLPNGSQPYGKTAEEDPNFHGNDQLWTKLWPKGIIYMLPSDRMPDGSFSQKWYFERGVHGTLSVEGHRLDAEAMPLRADIPDGYGDTGLQVLSLIFPTTGCWEVTGHVGDASLTFVTEVVFVEAYPTPSVTIIQRATPVPDQTGHAWRESKLYLNAPLPQSPAEANIYSLKETQPATADSALAKAEDFGVQGQVFQVPGQLANQTGYMVTDGKQRVYVQSDLDYAYYSDYGSSSYISGNKNITDEQATTIIDGFLKAHGLDFPYKLENPHINPGMFYVLPLSPDGMPVYHDYNLPSRLEATLDDKGQVILLTSYQDNFEAVGTFSIRTAEEAFQQILDQSNSIQNGILEIMRSAGGTEAGFWPRSYPDNETITIYGQPASYPAAQPGESPYIGIGQFTATGNTAGIENVDSSAYIEATGQFITENGIRQFNVNSWKVTDAMEAYPTGSLHQEGDRTILTAEDGSGQYVIEDAPAGLPYDMPEGSYLAVHGFLKNGQLNWDTINYYPAGSGGGGGGGSGTGFYKLNLSGTPVPFPTPTSMPSAAQGNIEYSVKEGDTLDAIAASYGITPEKIFQANHMQNGDVLAPGTVLTIPVGKSNSGATEYTVKEGDTCSSIAATFNVSIRNLISENNLSENCLIAVGDVLKIASPSNTSFPVGQRIEGQRGTLIEVIYRQPDGNQRVEYELYGNSGDPFYAVLEGDNLQSLEAYQNRPVEIWGTIDRLDQNGFPVIKVERYEIPYPGLQFKVLSGKQKVAELNGERVALFTASDGTTYAQLTSSGVPDITMLGSEGSDVQLETLAIPGETLGSYPAIRVYGGAMAINPKDGKPIEITITADQPLIVDQGPLPSGQENFVPPSITIEQVELVYYVPDPRTGRQSANPDAKYLQPAWRFYGHYSDGSEVEFLVQALKQEFLSPELAPYTGPG